MSSNPDQPLSSQECALIRMQRHEGVRYHNIADNLDISIRTATMCVQGKCECDTEVPVIDDDSPWREAHVMRELFIEENLYFTEMADLLGCHPETARNWVIRHDVNPVPSSQRTSSKVVRKLQRMGAKEQQEREQNGGDEYTNNFPGAR